MRLGRSVAGWQREPQPAAPAGRWAARTGYSRLPTSALQNACCGCTGEQLQASARRSSVASSRRPSASRRLRAAAPMARWGPVSGCCGAGCGAGHAPPHLARSPAQTFCPLCVGGKRREEGAGQCTRRRRKRLGGGERAQPGSAPPLPSMAVFAAGSGRAAVLLRSEDPLLLLSVAGGQCRPGAPNSPPPAPPSPPQNPGFCCAQPGTALGFPHHLARCATGPRALRT